ncbi:hypothetical protein AMEX_G3955 [Astyanax mexicanus]|uniref:Interleukin n=1 Tax=Astyanax mexicanus TaxID=7994 RepID=A0A8T2MCV5_ASTMX|nr:hypothetical protein AMEX_G3955 [Astyanax mexicanus]
MQQLHQTTSNSQALMLKITQWRNYSTNTMLSLNWILVLTLAHLHYLATSLSLSSVKWNHLVELNDTICKENTSFHSPTTHVEHNCTVSALKCTMRELEKAQSKCSYIRHHLQINGKAKRIIDSLTKRSASTDNATNCTPCDGYEVEPYKKFITNLYPLINRLIAVG